jgi:hypothetical protein
MRNYLTSKHSLLKVSFGLFSATIALGLAFGVTSCKERGVAIDFTPKDASLLDTTYMLDVVPVAQPRAVFIEDFTGVQCVNCPRAHKFIKDAIYADPDRVHSLAIHSAQGQFSTPIEGASVRDFRLPAANQLDALQGNSQAWPALTFDREVIGGSRYVSLVGWAGALADAMADTSRVNITMETLNYNETSRELSYRVTVTYVNEEFGSNNLSIAVAESEMVDAQKNSALPDPDHDIDTFYVHNHVLRQMVTAVGGNALGVPDRKPGRTIVRDYRMTLKPDWAAENIEIVAWVHRAGQNGDMRVLQSAILDVL